MITLKEKLEYQEQDPPVSWNVSSLQKALKKKNEEYELLKQMVMDRDRNIKRIEEANKKEINNILIEKKATNDTLARLTDENTKLKDKETTLIEVFKTMEPQWILKRICHQTFLKTQ